MPQQNESDDSYADVLNPVDIEHRIRKISNRIAAGVKVCSTRYEEFLAANHAYELEYARAYLDYDGPAHEKRYAADIACEEKRHLRDVADAAYRYADRTAKALENELRAYQSVGASIRQMYSVAGRGEGS